MADNKHKHTGLLPTDKINFLVNESEVVADALKFLAEDATTDMVELVHRYYAARELAKALIYEVERYDYRMTQVFDVLNGVEFVKPEDEDPRIIAAMRRIEETIHRDKQKTPKCIGSTKISMKKIVAGMTVKVSVVGGRKARARMKIGCWIVKLACKIMGTKCCLETVHDVILDKLYDPNTYPRKTDDPNIVELTPVDGWKRWAKLEDLSDEDRSKLASNNL